MTFRLIYFVLTIFLFFSFALSIERHAYAYVDPGSGLVALQAVGTLFAGALFYMRRRLKRLFLRVSPQRKPPKVAG